MYVSFESSSKNISLISTLIASGLLAIAGAIGYDGYKSIVGESVLIKKGKGAVRNLYLIVEKINNTSLRTNVEDFNKDEIINLLSLVEKDVVNSIQEWEDVVPGLAAIPYYNKYISEREEELKTATEKLKETEELLIKTTDLAVDSEQKKESLEKEIISYKETIKSKETEIRQLQGARDIQVVTASTAATGTSGYGGRTIIPDSVFRNPPLPPPPYPRGLRAAHLLSKSEKQANNLADQEP
jgi:MoaA/NifB/PqqE/SkfB family radical SAM enzyme